MSARIYPDVNTSEASNNLAEQADPPGRGGTSTASTNSAASFSWGLAIVGGAAANPLIYRLVER